MTGKITNLRKDIYLIFSDILRLLALWTISIGGKQLPFLFHPKYHLFVFPFWGDIWALMKFYLIHGLLIMVKTTYTLNFHRTTLNGFSSNRWTISIEHKNGSCTVSSLVIAPSGALSRQTSLKTSFNGLMDVVIGKTEQNGATQTLKQL